MKITVNEKFIFISEKDVVNHGECGVNLCEFTLPPSFEGLNVTAVFNGIFVPVLEGRCYMPSLNEGNCDLGVFAYRKSDEGIEIMYSPKPTVFWVGEGSYTDEVPYDLPRLSSYEEYLRMLQSFWREIIEENTLPQYTESATAEQYYSAAALNEMYQNISGELDEVEDIIGGFGTITDESDKVTGELTGESE